MTTNARIAAVATALPAYRVGQEEIQKACRRIFRGHAHLKKLLRVFEHAGVQERYFAFPLDYYLNGHTFTERNRDYIAQAKRLGVQVIQAVLERAGCGVLDIDQFYFVTTTGLSTPSIDALLSSDLGFRPDLERYPFFGLGCAGGAAALGRAAHTLTQNGIRRSLILSIELCGQTFLNRDLSPANLIGAALFGDGAAAVILDREGPGPAVVGWGSELFEATQDIMGWEFIDDGFKLVLSQSVPKAITTHVAPAIERFLTRYHLTLSQIQHFLLHPGGSKVLRAYESSLKADLRWTQRSLERVGNLSSASVLFILHDLLESKTARRGDLGLLASVGPGFAMEAALLRW